MDIPLVSVEVHSHHGPIDAMHNPPQPLKVSQKTLVSFLMEIRLISIDFLILDASVLRTASTAVKPCQGDSSKFYLITGNPDGRSYWIKTSQDSGPHCSYMTNKSKDIMKAQVHVSRLLLL
ncbi:hypothetical protein Tco_0205417 [Tanacetum coccineum]